MSDNEEIIYTETKNYKFRKDSHDNYYDIGVVNDNLDKIDKTIKAVKDENTNVQSDWNIADTKSDAFIKNKPTSLPANGGNADTVDGKHANNFAPSGYGLGGASQFVTGDWNNYMKTGFYYGSDLLNQPPTPAGTNTTWFVISIKFSDDRWCTQVAFNAQDINLNYIRKKINNTWSQWTKINDGGNADTIKNTLPINKGGTGATSVVNALKNLNLLNNNLNSTPSCSALTYRNYTDFGLESMNMFSFASLLADYSTIIFLTSKYAKAYISDMPTDEGIILFTRGGLNHRVALFFSTANNNRGVVYQWSANSQILFQNWTRINDGGNADTVDGKHAEDFATAAQMTTANNALNNKVDKVTGKGLSTNDFTAAYKTKVDGIANGAEANVQSDWNITDTSSDAFIKNKPTSLPANGGNADTIKNTLPIDKGGTGATDVVEVLKNLRLAHKNISEVPKSALLTYDPVSIIIPIFGARTVTMLEFTNALPSDINIMCKHFNSSVCGISDLPTIQGDLLIMKSYPAAAMKKVFAIFFDNENGGGLYYWMSVNEKVVIDWCGLVNEKQIQDFATTSQITDINTTLNTKVDKISGKGLSTNDFTAAYKTKLDGIANSADSNVQSDWNEKNTGSDAYIKNKPTSLPANGGNADTVDGKHAADLQNYNNLTNKPTSLPANGGNADTVDGKHASEFSVGTNKYIEFEAESNNWYRVAWSYIGRCNGVLAITLRTVVDDYNSFAVLAISLENNAQSITTGKYYLDINVLSKNTSWDVMKKLRIVSGYIQGYGKGDYLDIFVGTKGKVVLEMSFLGSMFEPLRTIEKIDTVNTEDIKKEIEL